MIGRRGVRRDRCAGPAGRPRPGVGGGRLPAPTPGATKLTAARLWSELELAAGPRPVRELEAAAVSAWYTPKTLDRAGAASQLTRT